MSRRALFFTLSLSVASGAALVACGGGDDAAPVAAPTPGPTPAPGPTPTPPPVTPPGGSPTPAPDAAATAAASTSATAAPHRHRRGASPPFEINVGTPPPPVVKRRHAEAHGVRDRAVDARGAWRSCRTVGCWSRRKGGTSAVVSANGTVVCAARSRRADGRLRSGQGGLLDVALDPEFDLAPTAASTCLFRARPELAPTARPSRAPTSMRPQTALENVHGDLPAVAKKVSQRPLRQPLIFRPDGTLFVTLGERQGDRRRGAVADARSLERSCASTRTAAIPADNPYACQRRPARRAQSGATATAIRRPRDASDDRRTVGHRTRAAGRRRSEPGPADATISAGPTSPTAATTATPVGQHLPHRRRRAQRAVHAASSRSGTRPRRPRWRHVLHRQRGSRSGRAASSSAASRAGRCTGWS